MSDLAGVWAWLVGVVATGVPWLAESVTAVVLVWELVWALPQAEMAVRLKIAVAVRSNLFMF